MVPHYSPLLLPATLVSPRTLTFHTRNTSLPSAKLPFFTYDNFARSDTSSTTTRPSLSQMPLSPPDLTTVILFSLVSPILFLLDFNAFKMPLPVLYFLLLNVSITSPLRFASSIGFLFASESLSKLQHSPFKPLHNAHPHTYMNFSPLTLLQGLSAPTTKSFSLSPVLILPMAVALFLLPHLPSGISPLSSFAPLILTSLSVLP